MLSFRLCAILALSGLLACGASSTPADVGSRAAESTGLDAPGCFQARASALIGISRIVTLHAQGCAADTDCLVVETGVRCLESCSGAIVKSDRDAYLGDLDQYGGKVCAALPAGCEFAPSCASAEARCVNGTCRMIQ
jgi:hypothetical protein